jgi:predicted RNase H-like nuclease (RuvC/YqgF family)
MSEEKEEFNCVTCDTCGLDFKFPQKVEDLWRKSEKTFYCPNGHGLVWTKPKETDEEKELKKLRTEVKELKEKLLAAERQSEEHKKRVDELAAELEIWQPSYADKKKVV